LRSGGFKDVERRVRMTISKLISFHLTNLVSGDVTGYCIICGNYTAKGLKIKKVLSNSFTAWSTLTHGECICEECASIFADGRFRRKSFVVSEDNLEFFKNDSAIKILFDPPQPPFFIHIAKAGKKYTFLSLMNNVATNRKSYYFSYEKMDVPVYFKYEKAKEYLFYISEAIKRKVTKTELLQGFKIKTWERAIKEGFEDLLNQIRKFQKNPLWEVLVDVFR